MDHKITKNFTIIDEAFRSIHISDDDYIELSNCQTFLHLFSDVEDFRQPGKVVFPLSDLLLLIFITILKEKTNCFLQIAAYIDVNKEWYKEHHLIHDERVPSHDTIRRVMMYISSDLIHDVLMDRLYSFLVQLEKEIPKKHKKYKHQSIDGKEVRGSGRGDTTTSPKRNISLLNIYDNDLRTCIISEFVGEKTNEIPVFQELSKTMNMKKVIFTADALHTQRKTCDIIHKGKGYYVFPVKENQSLLLEEIKARFTTYKNKTTILESDKRVFEFYELPKTYAVDGFTGMKVFIKMISKVRKKTIVMHFISNLKEHDYIIDAIVSRWQIENDLHKEKDMYFNEDLIRYTDKKAVQSMAIFNNLGLIMIRLYHSIANVKSLSYAKLYVKSDPIKAFNLLLGVMDSKEIMDQVKSEIRKRTKS